jgi:NAD(P)-dependent dehydrogenase (short-subunit alcohol dehydrogenase family)
MSGEPCRIIVVGAGSGIGAAVATHFHDRGDHVLAVDVREHQTPAALSLQCDLRDAASINALLGQIGSGWDMLAHVAGIPATAPAADVLKVNYLGMRLMTEGMLPLLRALDHGPGHSGRRRVHQRDDGGGTHRAVGFTIL